MRSILMCGLALSTVLLPAGFAQQWEIGGLGGFGWYYNATVKNPAGSASAGFDPRIAIGVVAGQNMYDYFGGEIRYMYLSGGPRLKSGGLEANTSGYTNTIHYDLLVHTAPRDATIRPYFAAGAGIKVYSGTRDPSFLQPLLNFAVLRHVNQVEGLISVGGGLKYMFSRNGQFRVDFRTYFTPAPNELINPIFPSTIHGWIYNFVPSLGFSYVF